MKAAVTTRSEEFDIIWQYPEGDVMRYPFNNAEARSKALANLTAIGGREIMKREQQHTPTPWRTQDKDNNTYPVSILAEGRIVAYVLEHFDDKSLARTNAEYITQCVNSHEKLIAALSALVAANICNYERDTMRSEGLFDAAREALRQAGDAYPFGAEAWERNTQIVRQLIEAGTVAAGDDEEPTFAQLTARD